MLINTNFFFYRRDHNTKFVSERKTRTTLLGGRNIHTKYASGERPSFQTREYNNEKEKAVLESDSEPESRYFVTSPKRSCQIATFAAANLFRL